eukprot:6491008-Amphidinium_carterae.1
MAGEGTDLGEIPGGVTNFRDNQGLGELLKALPKPSKLEQQSQWFQWRFEFENYMSCISPDFHPELEAAVTSSGPCVVPADRSIQRRSVQLFAMLASLTTGRPAEIVRSLRETRNGFEAWRLLVREYEPQQAASKLTLLSELLRAAELNDLDPERYQSALMRWEEKIRRYEQMPGEKPGETASFPEDVRRAILLEKAPVAMQAYLRVQMTERTTFAELKDRVESYLRSLKASSPGGPTAMDIGAVTAHTPQPQRGGKGGTKQQRSLVCRCCGKEGHMKQDCPHKDKACRVCGKIGHLASVCRQQQQQQQQASQQQQPRQQQQQQRDSNKGKGKDGKKGGRGKQQGQVGAVEEETAAPNQPEGLAAAVGWVLAVGNTPEPKQDTQELLLVDSGATHTVFMEQAFQSDQVSGPSSVTLRNISGQPLLQKGSKIATGYTESGRSVTCQGVVAQVQRNILSVAKLQQQGYTVVFTPSGAWITRSAVERTSADAESLENHEGLWYLRVQTGHLRGSQHGKAIVAALEDGEQQTAEGEHPEAHHAQGRLGDADIAALDLAPHQAEWDERYATLTRRDRKAWRFRAPRGKDPVTKENVVRRITWWVRDGSVLRDDYMADVSDALSMSQVIPGGPKDIYTKYYYTVHPEPPVQVTARDTLADPAAAALPTPVLPDDVTRAQHCVTHTPYADWCTHCVAGRARGELHLRVEDQDPKEAEFELDWTFYTADAEPATSQGASASSTSPTLTVLGVVHRGTGMTTAMAVPSKGKGNFAETMAVRFILLVAGSQKRLRLRADGEPASRAFLQAVSARLRTHGIDAQPEHTERASHQSVGAVERSHGVVAAFLRTLLSAVEEGGGWKPDPGHPIFMWAVRHAAWLYSHHHRGRDRLTAYSRLTGKVDVRRLTQFGEKVLAQITTDKPKSKSASRWVSAIWVGVQESLEVTSSYVTLTPEGVLLTRCVRRLAIEHQWDGELMKAVKGLPWAPKETRHRGVSTPAFPLVSMQRDLEAVAAAETLVVPKPSSTPDRMQESQSVFRPQTSQRDPEEETPQLPQHMIPVSATAAPPVKEEALQLKRDRGNDAMDEDHEPTVLATPTEDQSDEQALKRVRATLVASVVSTQDAMLKVQQFLEDEVTDARPQAEFGTCGNLEEIA